MHLLLLAFKLDPFNLPNDFDLEVGQDEDHLEEKDNNRTQQPVSTKQFKVESAADVCTFKEEEEDSVVAAKQNKESINNIENLLHML